MSTTRPPSPGKPGRGRRKTDAADAVAAPTGVPERRVAPASGPDAQHPVEGPATAAHRGPGGGDASARHFTLDGRPIPFRDGDTVIAAAARAGAGVPHLCWHPRLGQSGACRVCTVRIDGRLAAACTSRAADGQVVECRTAELDHRRLRLLQMLFVEGNHFCPSCEKSGDCLLQATAYEMGMTGPQFEEFYPLRPVDASHPQVWLDLNRCILCKLCVRASHEVDHKDVFAIGGYGVDAHLIVDSPSGRLGDSRFAADDYAAGVCPVGAILPKRHGFVVPIGERRFDRQPEAAGGADAVGGGQTAAADAPAAGAGKPAAATDEPTAGPRRPAAANRTAAPPPARRREDR